MLNMFNTSVEVSESGIDTAVLPLGSLEPKGAHLPLGFDFLLAERFSLDFCRGKAVYLLPPWPYSSAMEAFGFHGTAVLSQQNLWDVIGDLASVLARHRFKRLIIIDMSNYNWIVKHRVRELNLDDEVVQAVWVNPKQFALESADKSLLPDYGGGAVETSIGLHLMKDLVKLPTSDFAPSVPREYIDYRGLKTLSSSGLWGKPSKATEKLGAAFYQTMMEKTRAYVDYALGLFDGGRPIESDESEEIFWPEGSTPGVAGSGVDWTNTLHEISHSPTDMAILATGAIEQHSPSLPLGTDHFQAVELSRRVAQEFKAYLLPSLPVVTSWGHIRFRGTATLRAMTVRRVLTDIAESVRVAGFRKMAIINVHGGNWVVKPTIIEFNQAHPDFTLVANADILAYRGQAPVEHLHADEGEASFVRAFHPKAFKADKVVDFSPNCTASAFDLVGIGGVTPQGVWGYPSKATPEAGLADMEERVADTTEHIRKTIADLQGHYSARLK